ncbi:hypothetical protein BDV24DRAFT_166771 [Aspergillus arachidicola]|uniref:WD40 repeat-like protein n=1 Tax=Aspergillus arachidicola TaxID=656916 RepID=A0A5N6XXN0_9EURO|nr:hypothetical protein BDV24DRAFT_166771 [Aspergillus arachidicola]
MKLPYWHPLTTLDKTVRIWNLATRHYVSTLEGHSDTVTTTAWSPDGSRLASASDDKTVRIWDPSTGYRVSTLDIHSHGLQFDRLTPNHLHTILSALDLRSIKSVGSSASCLALPTIYGFGLNYENGLHIPDDVTLLFADDNNGTLRRLPVGKERNRPGGAILYYHFEFVGHPRSYRWLNSNFLPKVWHQLDEAYEAGVDRIWVFNVGDIKPMEVPLSFAMMKAWDNEALQPSQLPEFFNEFVNSNFKLSDEEARECSQLLFGYDQLMALGKHECIKAETFSLINYHEADEVLQRWTSLSEMAKQVHDQVDPEL